MVIEWVIARWTPAFAVHGVELLRLVDEGETLQLLQSNRHWTRTATGRARNWSRSLHPWLPVAAHLLTVDNQLCLSNQHFPLHLQAKVGGGIKEPALHSMADLKLQVAIRSDDSRVEDDDTSVSALPHRHPALSKEPESQMS